MISKKKNCNFVQTQKSFETYIKINSSHLSEIQDQLIEFHKKCVKKNGHTKISLDNDCIIIETVYGLIIINFKFNLEENDIFTEAENISFNFNTEMLAATDAPPRST
jgi:hypothetical protein